RSEQKPEIRLDLALGAGEGEGGLGLIGPYIERAADQNGLAAVDARQNFEHAGHLFLEGDHVVTGDEPKLPLYRAARWHPGIVRLLLRRRLVAADIEHGIRQVGGIGLALPLLLDLGTGL